MPRLKDNEISATRIAKALFAAVLACIALWYIHFQARDLLMGPRITLQENLDSVQNERIIILQGEARNVTYLSLNGKQIYTDAKGTFQIKLVLEEGYTIMTLYARDRFGRTTSLSRPFVYVPASTIN